MKQPRVRHFPPARLLPALTVCLLMCVACGQSNPPTAPQPRPTPSPTWPPTMDVPSLSATIAAIAPTLPTATLDVGRPLNKALVEQQDELYRRAQETALANYTPVPVLAPIDTPVPPLTPWGGPPTQIAGAGKIVQTGYCGMDKLIISQNRWQEISGTVGILVCAGSTYYPPHAQLLVEVADATTHAVLRGPDLYEVPGQAESVEIVDAVGERLTLRAADGTLFYFDVPTRQWVNLTPTPVP